MTESERLEDIDYWWSGFPGAFSADFSDAPIEPRLLGAFRRVLTAMPETDFERFMELRPSIVCQPVVDGTAYSYYVPHRPGADFTRIYVLYFRPDLRKRSDESITRLVAHEVAHLILGHTSGLVVGEGDVNGEEAADRKAEAWGFKGAYSRAHRRQLAREHEQNRRKRGTT